METKSDQKPVRRVLKKVKDFKNVYEYFSYITTEFGDDTLHYEGYIYNWTADELIDMYLTGDTDAVWRLAVPETPDYSQLPFIKSCYEPPEKPKVKYSGADIVQFPCRPALKTVEEYFEAKRVNDKLYEHPRNNHWWPSRHLDPEFAKLKLKDSVCGGGSVRSPPSPFMPPVSFQFSFCSFFIIH